MNTQIITNLELDQLSESAKKELLSILEKRETSISDLKKRVFKLFCQRISYRDDINRVISTDADDFLNFVIWRKTAGEQWSNSLGNEYIMKFGTKYIRIEHNSWNSESNINHPAGTTYISKEQAGELILLVERAFESDNNVDKDKLLALAGQQIAILACRY